MFAPNAKKRKLLGAQLLAAVTAMGEPSRVSEREVRSTPSRDPYRIFVAAMAAAAALILIATQLVGNDGGAGAGEAGEVRLEPLNYTPPDPFTDPLTPSPAPSPAPTGADAIDTSLTDDVQLAVEPASAGAVRSIDPDEVGLYGGSLNYSRCQRQKLVEFLRSSSAKARAWIDALNADPTLSWSGGNRLTVNDIQAYIFELTPVVLRADTWVTNHDYRDGRAIALQSVLQAGTAVLVDAYGVPRVKCYCGNPLLPPRRFPPTYSGPRWPGFDPGKVVIINNSTTIIDVFVLTNIDTGGLIDRPPGTDGGEDTPTGPPTTGTTGPTFTVPPDVQLGTGDVQVTLLWRSGDDLDLHVIDPQGSELYYSVPTSESGGQLDHDDTGGCGTEGTHAENVFWPEGGAPSGTYQAFVQNYSGCGAPAAFELRVTVAGAVVQTIRGSLAGGEQSEVVTFEA
jgi:hypothetical protein